MRAYCCSILSPIGPLDVEFSEDGLVSFGIGNDVGSSRSSGPYDKTDDDRLAAIKTFVTDHFHGRDSGRRDIPLDMSGISPFRRSVYIELMKVPFGELVTYGELARKVNNPKGARAVGNAMNANPYLLLVPCHRVVASATGGRYSLGGFGAGTDLKRLLLRMEGHEPSMVKGL